MDPTGYHVWEELQCLFLYIILFQPAIRYHGSHWISSFGGSSTRQSFSTISRKSEKKKHHRRNIIVIILIAIALLAALAMIVGISIFFTKEKGMFHALVNIFHSIFYLTNIQIYR